MEETDRQKRHDSIPTFDAGSFDKLSAASAVLSATSLVSFYDSTLDGGGLIDKRLRLSRWQAFDLVPEKSRRGDPIVRGRKWESFASRNTIYLLAGAIALHKMEFPDVPWPGNAKLNVYVFIDPETLDIPDAMIEASVGVLGREYAWSSRLFSFIVIGPEK